MITTLGLVTAILVVTIWFAHRRWTQYVLAATAVFPQTAALVIGDNGFPLFYLAVVLVAMLSVPYLLLELAHPGTVPAVARRSSRIPDLLALTLVAWGALVTIAGPRVFAGMLVFAPELGIGDIENMVPLQPGLGNLAQLGYLTMAVAFLLLAGRLFPVDGRMLGAALWLAVTLAIVRLVAEPVWPRELLQNMPGFNYATPERLSGTLHEPSVLGLYLVAAAAWFGAQLLRGGPLRTISSVIGLGLVAVDFVANNSGTALLGLAIVGMLAALAAAYRLVSSGRVRVRPGVIAAAFVVAGAALTQLSLLYAMTVGYAADKTQGESFADRGASNLRSWQILVESFGIGIGLGGNRPSSLLFLVLSCLGVVGFGLLLALVLLALRRAAARPATVPAGWTLVAVLVAAGVAVPDLSAPLLWTAIAVCLAGRDRELNPPLNPDAYAEHTPPVQVVGRGVTGSGAPSLGDTRIAQPASPAVPHRVALTRNQRLDGTLRVTPKDAA